jgi:spore maturation protein CgeB
MTHRTKYTAEALKESGDVIDVRIHVRGKVWHLWGRGGPERERRMAADVAPDTLPVLIGAGLGHCLRALAERGIPVAVVDREAEMERVTGVRREFAESLGVTWIDADSPKDALDQLTRWQAANGSAPFSPVVIPLYQRLDKAHYGPLADTLKARASVDFWSQARYPKFCSASPRVLFLDSGYFLCGELLSALPRLDVDHRTITLARRDTGSSDFIESLLRTVIDFRPDFVLTVNHFGLDREGKLAGLLAEMGLPLASWFVDNPSLILHDYAHPGADNTAIFTFDAGNLDAMRRKGFAHVHYLPLATDPERFRPRLSATAPSEWKSDVSFVGNSMTEPVARCLSDAGLPEAMVAGYEEVAAAFGASGETDVREFLARSRPDWLAVLDALPSQENRLALESLLTWEATRQYRLACVNRTLSFAPLIVGDDGWTALLPPDGGWRHLPGLDYYDDLPRFYPLSAVNFNCTSRQMIGAVNQRVFDVPACGGFVLTDHREQMEDLFDLDSEAVVYRTPEEIPGLLEELLADTARREAISRAARRRILAEHTYDFRLRTLLKTMRETFTA